MNSLLENVWLKAKEAFTFMLDACRLNHQSAAKEQNL